MLNLFFIFLKKLKKRNHKKSSGIEAYMKAAYEVALEREQAYIKLGLW